MAIINLSCTNNTQYNFLKYDNQDCIKSYALHNLILPNNLNLLKINKNNIIMLNIKKGHCNNKLDIKPPIDKNSKN
ncbi:MAG: hypothetical protein ACMZHY_01085 [Enterobacterales bacterium]